MINTQDIRDKEVINIYDGKSLGFVYDVEIDLERGTVEGIVVPARRRLFHFGNTDDQVIRWKDIRRIGTDVVLVDLPGLGGDITYDRDEPQDIYGRGFSAGSAALSGSASAARTNSRMPDEEGRQDQAETGAIQE